MYTKTTLLDIKTALSYRYGEETLPTDSATVSKRNHFINRGIEYILSRLKPVKKTTLTVASGTVTLPTDFRTPFFIFDTAGNQLSQISKTESTATTGFVYWIDGTFKDGYTFNTSTDGDYDVFYEYYPAPLASDVDISEVADGEAVACYAYAMIRKSESDPLDDADKSLTECENRIGQMIEEARENDKPFNMQI